MKACISLTVAMCCALLSGCVHHHGSAHGAKVAIPSKVIVPVIVEPAKSDKKHCPPGQAKKGNC
jgi:hypothetical protein